MWQKTQYILSHWQHSVKNGWREKKESLIEAFSASSEYIQQVEIIFNFVTAAATDPMGQARRGGLGHRSVK